jgi:SsrA-binding protein
VSKERDDAAVRVLATNRKAFHDYEILERHEAGIALRGTEVKAFREDGFQFRDSFVEHRNGELFLSGASVAPYSHGNRLNHTEDRQRKLLLHKREIVKLGAKVAEKGYTLIPLRAYMKGGRVKFEIALVRGRQAHDKREAIKKRDIEKDVRRELGRRRA